MIVDFGFKCTTYDSHKRQIRPDYGALTIYCIRSQSAEAKPIFRNIFRMHEKLEGQATPTNQQRVCSEPVFGNDKLSFLL